MLDCQRHHRRLITNEKKLQQFEAAQERLSAIGERLLQRYFLKPFKFNEFLFLSNPVDRIF